MKEEKKYACICGKEFNNPQSFNGHKGYCREHQLDKYGNLDVYNKNRERTLNNCFKSNKSKIEKARQNKSLSLEKWLSEKHICEKCGKVMTEYFGSGRFCSRKCANSRRHSKATREKISKSCTGKVYKTRRKNNKNHNKEFKYCKLCNKKLSRRNITGYCSECTAHAPELKEYRSQRAKHASSFVKTENRKYWQPRNQISYPEKFFIKVLNNNNIEFIHDYMVKIDEKHWYYLDFYIEKGTNKLDLEIDGRQHEDEDRKQHDIKRNKDLTNLGYIVYRIKWNEINSEKGKTEMKNKIDNFLEFYNSL